MRRSKILLVNGEATVQHLRALMLRMKGHEVHTIATLQEAEAELENRHYDLVIVDVGHFADPGLEFCERMKDKYPDLKVLMQVDFHLFMNRNTCPDKVISKQEGPQHFLDEVEAAIGGAA